MQVSLRAYRGNDLVQMIAIWNEVVQASVAFSQIEPLIMEGGKAFVWQQSDTGVAMADDGHTVLGRYLLHPNSIGRCGHIRNASDAVSAQCRGRHIGESRYRAKRTAFAFCLSMPW